MTRAIPILVLAFGILLAAAAGVYAIFEWDSDYADLVPAPDSIIWWEGQESTVLVSTNLDDVDLSIDSVAMGISNVLGAVPHSGELMILGASVGCQDWAVSRLTADTISTGGYSLKGNIDRDNFTSTARVHYRSRVKGETDWTQGNYLEVDYDSNDLPASNRFDQHFNVTNEIFEVEASSDDGFPIALTRFVTIDTTAGTATVDEEAESIVLLKDTGVALKACSQHDDVMLTLNSEDGEELNRYVVDIGQQVPTPAPTATPIPSPVFSPAYETLRFCPDADSPRDAILTGDEAVGTVTATGSGTISYFLAPDGDSRDFAFFEIDSAGAITVSDAGGDDHTGIDGSRLYTFVVRATDDAGRTGEALVCRAGGFERHSRCR